MEKEHTEKHWILKVSAFKINLLEKLNPLVMFFARFWVAMIFWNSGILKLPYGFLGVGKGNWQTTLYLYTNEHPVPGIPPELAAYSGTFFEVLCPVLLFFGFGARIGAFILIIMSIVIEYTYQHSPEHIYWMIILAIIFVQGPGKLSIDHFIRRKVLK